MDSEKIWLSLNKELKILVLSKVRDTDSANDILQDVFIKIHTHISNLRDSEKRRQWIYRITRNAINDYFRKIKNKVGLDEVRYVDEKPEDQPSSMVNCVKPHINKLPEKYKEAITLVELEGLSQIELAKTLNISYSAAKSRVQRGRDLLRSYFENCCKIIADKYGNIVSHSEKEGCTLCTC